MKYRKCLYCYSPIKTKNLHFHPECCKKIFVTEKPPLLAFTMDEMEELAKKMVETSVTVPGVQPKLSLGLVRDALNNDISRLTVIGALGGSYILKPQNITFPEMPENEHLTMKLAEICGISVVPSSLIKLKSGELSYITKRIDRADNGEKIHMLDMFQITEAFDKYRSSVEKVGKAVAEYSSNTLFDLVRLFEIIVFCHITGNNDMHLKNFSLIKNGENWQLSAAYDLLNVHLHLPEDNEETALTILGKKRKLNQQDFVELGTKFQLNSKQIENTFKRFIKAETKMKAQIRKSFLSRDNQKNYISLLSERLELLK